MSEDYTLPGSTRRQPPARAIIRIRPEQIAHGTLMRNLLRRNIKEGGLENTNTEPEHGSVTKYCRECRWQVIDRRVSRKSD